MESATFNTAITAIDLPNSLISSEVSDDNDRVSKFTSLMEARI